MPRGDGTGTETERDQLPDPIRTGTVTNMTPSCTTFKRLPHIELEMLRIVEMKETNRILHPDQPAPGVECSDSEQAADLIASHDASLMSEALSRGLVIDLDDTLTTNVPLFDYARWHLTAIYAEASGRDDVLNLMEEREQICQALLPTLGYTPKRWRTACMDYLDQVAPNASDEIRGRVGAAAEVALGVGEFYAGVERTLAAMKNAGVPMLLLTKGEEAKQSEKIKAHGLDRFFDTDRMIIVPHKDAKVLSETISSVGLEDPVVVGDSAASDIAPALEAGLDAIHVDRGGPTWAAEHHDSGDIHEAKASSFPIAVQGLIPVSFKRVA